MEWNNVKYIEYIFQQDKVFGHKKYWGITIHLDNNHNSQTGYVYNKKGTD